MASGDIVGGRYEIVRELGRGGMGEVLLARQLNLSRLVVVKRVLEEHDGQFVSALLEEARVAARLHHPTIVAILDVSRGGEDAYIAMEYVAGVSLREMIERAPDGLPEEVALVIAHDVLRGLAYAHTVKSGELVGIVHRDVKPRNIMVTVAGDTKLIDFGISRWLSHEATREVTSISGTEGYMPPEQAAGSIVDGRADQYAIGVTLREMLTGVSPYDATKKPARELDVELAAIVDSATAKSAEDRFASCDAMEQAIERYAKARGIALSPVVAERWIREHLDDRVAELDRELERASEPGLVVLPAGSGRVNGADGATVPEKPRPKTQPTPTSEAPTRAERDSSTHDAGSGRLPGSEPPAPPEPGPPTPTRSRRSVVIGCLVVGLVAVGILIAVVATRRHVATTTPVVAFAAKNLGGVDDDWLAPAVEHVAYRAMRDLAKRPFWIVRAGDARATSIVELGYRHTQSGIRLEPKLDGNVIARIDADSVVDAIEQMSSTVARAIGTDPVGPDATERHEMELYAQPDWDRYRRFRMLVDDSRMPGWYDSTPTIAGLEQLVKEDPAWSRPYAELDWLYGRTTPKAKANAEAAHAHADLQRDPDGMKLLEALRNWTIDRTDTLLPLAQAIYEKNPGDILAGEIVAGGYQSAEQTDEGRAINRRILESYPASYVAGDIATDLDKDGRDVEVEQFLRAVVSTDPDNMSASRELARALASKGDLDAARRVAHHALLIHGERPLALAELYEAMISSDELAEAQRLVDRMVLGSPLAKARGHYRVAVIAALEGRFEVAFAQARRAITEFEPFGEESETGPALLLLRTLAPLVGEDPKPIALEHALYQERRLANTAAPVLRYQAALVEKRCPAYDEFLAEVKGPMRSTLTRAMMRHGAIGGCTPCSEVVANGRFETDKDTESLFAFATCAEREGKLDLARQAFERTSQQAAGFSNRTASPIYAVLAHAHLAAVLVTLGDRAGAKREYERFLRFWGKADHPPPEVAAAREALKSL